MLFIFLQKHNQTDNEPLVTENRHKIHSIVYTK